MNQMYDSPLQNFRFFVCVNYSKFEVDP